MSSPQGEKWPPRACRTCGLWKPHEDYEVLGRSGKDKGCVLLKADCAACRKAWVEELRARLLEVQKRKLEARRVATGNPKLKAPKPLTAKESRPYRYLGKVPALIALAMKMGFYLGRAIGLPRGMKKKMSFASHYEYRKRLIDAMSAARKRVAKGAEEAGTRAQDTASPTTEREEHEWERMRQEVEELARKLGQVS